MPIGKDLTGEIVNVQRKILAEEINPDVTKVPQLWCLYKEVQDFYNDGMRVRPMISRCFGPRTTGAMSAVCPAPRNGMRTGGAGIYYHFDYHGGPRSYQWINTSPISKIWDQMSLAKQYGADRIWIVNVGHFKGYEFPLGILHEPRLGHQPVDQYQPQRIHPALGAPANSAPPMPMDIADIIDQYTKYNGRRKPELLDAEHLQPGSTTRKPSAWWRTTRPSRAKAEEIHGAAASGDDRTLFTNWSCSRPKPAPN